MREFLTGLAILVCLALIAAMAGPYFVDWTARKPLFEQQIRAMTGIEARIDGRIAVTLLPTPSLSLEQVRIGAADSGGFVPFEVDRLTAALSATALLRGDVVVTEAVLERPLLRIDQDAAQATMSMAWPPAHMPAISLERLILRDGALQIRRPGREALGVSDVVAEIEASSLSGPAKISSAFQIDGTRRVLRMGIGRIEAGKVRIKLHVEDASNAVRVEADGVAGWSSEGPGFDGTLSLVGNPVLDASGKVQLPMRAQAKAAYSAGTLGLDGIEMTLGSDPMPLTLAGSGQLKLSNGVRAELTLSGRSYDFDRPGPDGQTKLSVPADLAAQWAAMGGDDDLMALLPDGRIDLSIGGIILGGQTLTGVRAVLARQDGRTRIEALEGELPGQTSLHFERDSLSRNEWINGLASIRSRDPERLHGWFNGVNRVATAEAGMSAQAVLSTAAGGVRIDRIEIDRGETHLSGEGSYLLAQVGVRPAPRLVLKLASPRLLVEDLPAYVVNTERREVKPELDFEVELDASRLVVEGRETGRLTARMRRDGAVVSIERIALTDLDGADLIASGTLGSGARRITLKLDAARLGGLAAVVERVFPSPAATALKARAAQLAPALVVASLADQEGDGGYSLTAEGRLGDTAVRIGGSLVNRSDLMVDLTLDLDNADGAALARQVFGGASTRAGSLPGFVRLSARGAVRGAVLVGIEMGVAGTSARIDGHIRLFQPFAPFEGVMVASVPDLVAAAPVLGIDAALLPAAGAARLSSRLEGNLKHMVLPEFRALVGDVPLGGEIAFRIADGGRIAGQIRLPSVDFRLIAGVALGRSERLGTADGWSAAAFGAPFALPVTGDLWIEADRGIVAPDLSLANPKFVLRFEPQAVSIEYADLRLPSGRLTGDVFLKRIGVAAYLTSRLAFKDVDLAKGWPQALAGLTEGDVNLSGRGESPAKIAQTLAGSGSLRVRQGRLAGFDPAALERLLAIPLDQIGAIDTTNIGRRLEQELQRGTLEVADLQMPLVVIDGVARLGPVTLDRPAARIETAGGTLDLARWLSDLRLTLVANRAPEAWRGTPPQLAVQWRGPLMAARQSLSVDMLVSGLLGIALQRDIERNDIFEQDMRERAAFNRRRRAAEEEKFRQEQADWTRAETLRRAEQAVIAEQERQRRLKAAEEAAIRAQVDSPEIPAPPAEVLRDARPVSPPRPVAPARPLTLPPGAPLDLTPPGLR